MVYNENKTPWACECGSKEQVGADWTPAGNTCVPKDLRQQLEDDGWIGDRAFTVSYYDLIDLDAHGERIPSYTVKVSDTFNWLYIQSAIGCKD